MRLATSSALPLERLISHRMSADEFADAVDIARTSRDAIKVVMTW